MARSHHRRPYTTTHVVIIPCLLYQAEWRSRFEKEVNLWFILHHGSVWPHSAFEYLIIGIRFPLSGSYPWEQKQDQDCMVELGRTFSKMSETCNLRVGYHIMIWYEHQWDKIRLSGVITVGSRLCMLNACVAMGMKTHNSARLWRHGNCSNGQLEHQLKPWGGSSLNIGTSWNGWRYLSIWVDWYHWTILMFSQWWVVCKRSERRGRGSPECFSWKMPLPGYVGYFTKQLLKLSFYIVVRPGISLQWCYGA